ncbi:MAG: tryptophan 7-halogenase [Hormoscilla sp. GUM202]|nr:tryptophan 7-halogenase [Hormoscilla sp. GUM202]
MDKEYDMIAIGGGPAGSTAATLVAMQGHKVLLLERERFPRYQIGESLLPATINGIVQLLGAEDSVKQAGFIKKRGGTFSWGKETDVWTLNFGSSPVVGDPNDSNRVYAYEVKRDRFDRILLDNAREKGVEVREQHRVKNLVWSSDRVTGVVFGDPNGREERATARFVVDASGHQSKMAQQVGDRLYSQLYRNIAIYGYFVNGKRLPEPDSGNVLFEAFDDGWLWYIPLDDTLTSVGAVLPKERTGIKENQGNLAGTLQDYIAASPIISEYLAGAQPARETPYGEIRMRQEFSYCHSHFWKPGILLVGDAACFIDVLLSSGVHLATYGALLAARSINTALRGEIDEAVCLHEFELRYRLEYSRFYQLLSGLYDMEKERPTYHAWLRKWLRDTNAFSLEPFEQNVDRLIREKRPLPKNMSSVEFLRQLNGKMLLTAAIAQMEQVESLPAIEGNLVPSPDRLHWLD